MLKSIRIILIIILVVTALALIFDNARIGDATQFPEIIAPKSGMWEIQSIDTMKYSRDLAREKKYDKNFDQVIEKQIDAIAQTGATHVSIGTPYDPEFMPMLEKWVRAARKAGLKVWFRGNLSGWEKWFEYREITSVEHIKGITEFILANQDLFEDGDIFTSCPECENGAIGDPRENKRVDRFRAFLINEHKAISQIFEQIGKNVKTNFFSMNGDVARLAMDQATTQSLGNIITIDHHVADPVKLAEDLKEFGSENIKLVLGEVGAPIPDIHGPMTEDEQAEWIDQAMRELSQVDNLIALNYWSNMKGSSAIWNWDMSKRKAVDVLSSYFQTKHLYGYIYDDFYRPIANTRVKFNNQEIITNESGYFELPLVMIDQNQIQIAVDNYNEQTIVIDRTQTQKFDIKLIKKYKTLAEKLIIYFNQTIIQR
ncbi:hypothetical protein ACFLZ9_01310 [Patescibacteria group bacterium]